MIFDESVILFYEQFSKYLKLGVHKELTPRPPRRRMITSSSAVHGEVHGEVRNYETTEKMYDYDQFTFTTETPFTLV